MKKIFLIALLSVLLFSCMEPKTIQREDNYSSIDFTKYTEKGFLITTLNTTSDYESIGLISYKVFPAWYFTRIKNIIDVKKNGSAPIITQFRIISESITTSEIMDTLYNKCIEMGANGIIDFKIETISKTHTFFTFPKSVTLEGYLIRGLAIKRK